MIDAVVFAVVITGKNIACTLNTRIKTKRTTTCDIRFYIATNQAVYQHRLHFYTRMNKRNYMR